jgi:hypothetical protein
MTFAALAGGGSITAVRRPRRETAIPCTAQPDVEFFLLALVAVGIIGAHLVPAMASTDEGNRLVALVCSPIICASALLLLSYV